MGRYERTGTEVASILAKCEKRHPRLAHVTAANLQKSAKNGRIDRDRVTTRLRGEPFGLEPLVKLLLIWHALIESLQATGRGWPVTFGLRLPECWNESARWSVEIGSVNYTFT
ncbi:hypothetical protein V1638_15800 [Pseudarthrobacter sp. J64]|uniref:hypothetical protein n=1 Tax=Pseudarthrobacter sp. J64 TaxID=3116485 RepID=UPI002E80482E|nr:hypothetical protein [Pseudarthrobacter sp. J64]MEE2570845.1 hypothetical protein [Pseudarthrobacter sp. J64]